MVYYILSFIDFNFICSSTTYLSVACYLQILNDLNFNHFIIMESFPNLLCFIFYIFNV